MFDDILVPTDGSACAAVAVDHAGDLATRYGATVHVLCVVDSRTLENAPHLEREREEHAELAGSTCEDLSTAGLQTTEAVRTGVPHRAILEYVDEHGVDLVAMGTHGRTGVERLLLGSVTEKVVRLSDVPVLTVREADGGNLPYEDVLVPTDGSDGAAAAVDVGVDVARAYDARLHALSVVDTMALGIDVRSESILGTLEETARAAVEEVEDRAAAASVETVEAAVGHGEPADEVLAYVEDQSVDLLVIGSRGHGGRARHLLGGVTEALVRTSPAPVLVVPAPAD